MTKMDSKVIAEYKNSFSFFDANNDGFITADELQKAMNKCGVFPSKLELRMIMNEGDKDRNGVITFDEFIELMRNQENKMKYTEKQLKEQFRMFDKDNDGFIEREEMTKIVKELSLGAFYPKHVINQLFKEADVDGDEFVMAVS